MSEINIRFDGKLDIATGRSRREMNWKNREMLWSDLLKKLSVTHRTTESFAEYLASKKPRQDEIKDIGGFVGGYLNSGRKKKGSVRHRQLITLDADYANKDLWEDFIEMYDCAAGLYSTHKHSPDNPRYRLIIPVDRILLADEFVAISRKIAGMLGIDQFDHSTSYQLERLMYWPSSSADGVYEFQYQDGSWLNADEVLASYHNWQDSSEWPVSSRENQLVDRAMKKQGDPLEKKGIVGAFCRTYTIHEAIELFLSDQYEPCEIENRYTYKHGSTSGGLITYDDKFAYSWHSTDPAGSKLCNAFDLVRIHKFGLSDEDALATTPGNKLPSYLKMQDLASSDPAVSKLRSKENFESAKYDFTDEEEKPEAETEEENDDWKGQLKIDRRGEFQSTIDNIFLILKNDPKLKNRIVLNEFEGRLFVKKNLPWRKITAATSDFTDDDADCLSHYLESQKMPFTHVQKALAKLRTENRFHPVREYLEKLEWDGVERLEELFIDYLGAEDSLYTRVVTRKTLIAAVARIFEPGIKFDTVLTFVGKEGIGKSTIVSKLAGKWFSDCLGDIHTKEGMESLKGVWIMEIAELASLRKADQEAIKRFITSREDIYRPAYGRQLVRHPRQCLFFATTNKKDFLQSGDGNRRFLPIDTYVQDPQKDIFIDLSQPEINQLWAEAVNYYRAGEEINVPVEIYETASLVREQHTEQDDRKGIIENYLSKLLPENWDEMNVYDRRSFLNGEEELLKGTVERSRVCAAEIWCEALGGLQRDMTTQNTKFIHEVMRKLKGWEYSKTSHRLKIYGTQKVYEKSCENSVKTRCENKDFVKTRNGSFVKTEKQT